MSEPSRPAARRALPWRAIRSVVGLVLAGWLLVEVHPREVLNVLGGARPVGLLAALVLVLLDRSLMAYRWLMLLNGIDGGRRLPVGAVMRVFFVSTFLGTFLPAGLGGDVVRTVGLARLNVPPADAVASVVVDRIVGLFSLMLVAAGGLFVAREQVGGPAVLVLAIVGLAVTACGLLLLFDSRLLAGAVRMMASRLPRLERAAGRVLAAIRRYGDEGSALWRVLVASAGVQALRVLQAWALGLSLGLAVGLPWYAATIPVIVLIMSLPISVGGLGTSQVAFVVFFGAVGVVEADAFALSILFLALGVFGNLPGGALFMFGSSALTGSPTRSTR